MRVTTLVFMVVLGFTAVFPEWFDYATILKAQYETKQTDKDVRSIGETDNPGGTGPECGSEPVIRVARDYAEGSAVMPPAQPADDAAKVFINRDPEVFDFVCEGDPLKFSVYAENVDELMVAYEDIDSDMMSYETRNPVIFRNAMEFTVPIDWSGPAQIEASGFVSGRVGLASSKVTFEVKRRVAEMSYIKGVLLTGELSDHGLPIRFDFAASNKPLSSPAQRINDVERYWVQGQATVSGTR